jgi:hypothetical protein
MMDSMDSRAVPCVFIVLNLDNSNVDGLTSQILVTHDLNLSPLTNSFYPINHTDDPSITGPSSLPCLSLAASISQTPRCTYGWATTGTVQPDNQHPISHGRKLTYKCPRDGSPFSYYILKGGMMRTRVQAPQRPSRTGLHL